MLQDKLKNEPQQNMNLSSNSDFTNATAGMN